MTVALILAAVVAWVPIYAWLRFARSPRPPWR